MRGIDIDMRYVYDLLFLNFVPSVGSCLKNIFLVHILILCNYYITSFIGTEQCALFCVGQS